MQHLLGFKGKDVFNMNSVEGTLMITSIGLRSNAEWHWNPGPKRPNVSLRSLLSDMFSGTSCERFEEGYPQLTHSGVPISTGDIKFDLEQIATKTFMFLSICLWSK